jgi:hypothetical protein
VTASRALAHPIALLSIALLVVNDHVLKAAMPGLITGKLSDIAGMIFFPLLVAAAIEQLGIRRAGAIGISTIATGIAFTAIKLSPEAGDLYRVAFAVVQWPVRAVLAALSGSPTPSLGRAGLVADPTDLVALVALAVPLALGRASRCGTAEGPEDGAGTNAACQTRCVSRSSRSGCWSAPT